jgi:hypothetical protein
MDRAIARRYREDRAIEKIIVAFFEPLPRMTRSRLARADGSCTWFLYWLHLLGILMLKILSLSLSLS